MRKLLSLLIALAVTVGVSVSAFGQGFQGAFNPSILDPGPGGSYIGPADATGATFTHFYGWWAVSASYASGTAKLVKVSRTADAHTCDVMASATTGYASLTANCSTGGDNAQAWTTFCTTACTVSTLYDQGSGASNMTTNTAVAATTGSCFGVTADVCWTYNGTTSFSEDSTIAQAQPFTLVAVAERTGATTSFGQIIDSSTSDFGMIFSTSANTVNCYAGSVVAVTAADNAPHAIQCSMTNTTTSTAIVDGSTTTGNFGTSALGGNFQIGRGLNNLTGTVGEMGVVASAFNSTQWAAYNTNAHSRWGF